MALRARHERCPICLRAWSDVPARADRRYADVITKDHIVPLNKGGTDAIENLQPACYECNFAKCDGRDVLQRRSEGH
jgi:5-methylcytosine-specific restriction endonuclease McrA